MSICKTFQNLKDPKIAIRFLCIAYSLLVYFFESITQTYSRQVLCDTLKYVSPNLAEYC